MAKSKPYRLNSADVKKWATNMGLFLVPLVLIYLNTLIERVNAGEVSIKLFELTPALRGALLLYLLNAVTDLLKKFVK